MTTRAEILRQIDECEHQRSLLPAGEGYANERVLLANRIDFLRECLAHCDEQPARFMPLRENYRPVGSVSFARALATMLATVAAIVALMLYGLGAL